MPKRAKIQENDKAPKRAKTIKATPKNEPNSQKALLDKYKNKKDKLCFNEIKGDLFKCNDKASLAHCVSLDFKMGAGIAVGKKNFFIQSKILQNLFKKKKKEFKKRFKGSGELADQGN